MIGTPRFGRMSRGIWRKAMKPANRTATMATKTVMGRRIAARGRVMGRLGEYLREVVVEVADVVGHVVAKGHGLASPRVAEVSVPALGHRGHHMEQVAV